MMSLTDLLDLYKSEKQTLADLMDETPFPSFAEWKLEYQKDYQQNHRTVTVEEADKEMDAVVASVEETEDCLVELIAEFTVDNATNQADNDPVVRTNVIEFPTTSKEIFMETNAAVETPVVTAKADETATPARKKRPAAKATVAAEPKTKMELARSIYKSLSRGKNVDRAKIIERFMKDVKLSKNGAATYYQTLKSEKKAA